MFRGGTLMLVPLRTNERNERMPRYPVFAQEGDKPPVAYNPGWQVARRRYATATEDRPSCQKVEIRKARRQQPERGVSNPSSCLCGADVCRMAK